MSETKITGLSALNVRALREVLGDSSEIHALTATTATFKISPVKAVGLLEDIIANLPGRGHPRASLYAVVRKLRAQVLNGQQDVPSESEQTPEPEQVIDAINRDARPFGGAIHGEDGTAVDVEFPDMFKAANFVRLYSLEASAVISGQNRETFTDPVVVTFALASYVRSAGIEA